MGDELLVLEEDNEKHVNLSDREITGLFSQHKLPAGFSNEFSQLIGLKKYYEQAQKAVRHNSGSGLNISYYSSTFMLHDFREDIRDSVDYRDYCHKGMMSLHEYDMKHHAQACAGHCFSIFPAVEV